jgi:hypothetical protein
MRHQFVQNVVELTAGEAIVRRNTRLSALSKVKSGLAHANNAIAI